MRWTYAVLLLVATVFFAGGSALPTASIDDSNEVTAEKSSLDSVRGFGQNHGLLRKLETAEEDEERGLNLNFLKKFIPGTTNWKAVQTAKALKSASKQVKKQFLDDWLFNPKLYDKIVKNDNDLFETFKIWKRMGFSENAIYTGLQKLNKVKDKEYLQIYNRYKVYLGDFAPRVRVSNA